MRLCRFLDIDLRRSRPDKKSILISTVSHTQPLRHPINGVINHFPCSQSSSARQMATTIQESRFPEQLTFWLKNKECIVGLTPYSSALFGWRTGWEAGTIWQWWSKRDYTINGITSTSTSIRLHMHGMNEACANAGMPDGNGYYAWLLGMSNGFW